MEIDKDRVDEMVLALLYLTTFKDKPNWGNNLLDAQSRDCQNCSMRPFEGSWQRIERADAHRKTLAETWNSFIDDDPYSFSVRMEHDGTGRIWVRPNYPALPAIFSLELGELLYQLRAALDGCVYDAAILETRQNPPPDEQDLAFPICSSPESFDMPLGTSRHSRMTCGTLSSLYSRITLPNSNLS